MRRYERDDNDGFGRREYGRGGSGRYGGEDDDFGHQRRMSGGDSYSQRDEGRFDESDRRLAQHDEDYSSWREEQIRKLDDDYNEWRSERRKKFVDEFDKWRTDRSGKTAASGTQASELNKK
jgi:hypothetical protein